MKKTIATLLLVLMIAPPTSAQMIVLDPSNLARAVEIAQRTLQTYYLMQQQFETLQRMGKIASGQMNVKYRIPGVATFGHNTAEFEFAREWLEALNAGDARGTKYFRNAQVLKRPGNLFNALPDAAKQMIRSAYATVEVLDSVTMMGGHQAAIIRAYQGELQRLVSALEHDITSPNPDMHELTAVADKVAVGSLIARRQDMAANQLTSNILEQLLAQNKRTRDADVAALNRAFVQMQSGGIDTSIVDGSASALRNWRIP